MSMTKRKKLVYTDGRTKQSFKNITDINRILAKAQKTGVISHLAKHGAIYGDFSDLPDLLQANQRLARGQQIFDELPSEVRAEFGQDVSEFFKYVNDPENINDLATKLPALAEPGRQHRILDPMVQAGIQEAFEAIAATRQRSDSSEPQGGSESPEPTSGSESTEPTSGSGGGT